MNNIGFIGAGNMGGAMIWAIAQSGLGKVYVYDLNKACYENLKHENIICCDTYAAVLEQATYIVLSIKPQYYKGQCEAMKQQITSEHVMITVAPGYTIAQMKQMLGNDVKVVRTMPNTPALINQGVTAYSCEEGEISVMAEQEIGAYFGTFGKSFKVPEHLMDAVVPTSGCSPAYGYVMIEAMADAAVRMGLPRDMAYELSARSIKGACDMILETGKHPGELKDAVTSPGGATIVALNHMEATGFRNSIISSMVACYDKCIDMKK
ncbi:MAG: pyrroline-5-carboxylate reductase [Cellulosilyticaceae bacterium]